MTPFDPAELSAYLDGELPEERMREVESILASDPIARAEFDALASSDVAWRASARSARFSPRVELPIVTEARISIRLVAAFVVLLIIMQFAVNQVGTMALAVAFNALALALVVIGVVFSMKTTIVRQ